MTIDFLIHEKHPPRGHCDMNNVVVVDVVDVVVVVDVKDLDMNGLDLMMRTKQWS